MAIDRFDGEYSFLSNFAFVPVVYDGVTYPSVEHAYQAAKTWNLDERRVIEGLRFPGQAKRYGRRVSLRPDWEYVKVSIMRDLLRQKFADRQVDSTTSVYRRLLLNTGDEILIEGNDWGDTFWGKVNGKGQNVLGKLLMEIREEIKKEEAD